MATDTRNSRDYKVTAAERGGVKLILEGEKESLGRESKVRKMRGTEG